jgi:glutamate/tyrosine decarboxylase-like PLP-dependent enzyme
MGDHDELERAYRLATDFLDGLAERHVGPDTDATALRAALAGPLPETGEEAADVVEALASGADPGLSACAGPRYFGFVTGGTLPAALAADWLTSAWDQNASLYAISPAAAVVEEAAGAWILDLLDLPPESATGFVTGATMANLACLAAARHAVLTRRGHDPDRDGLAGCPPVTVVVGDEVHASVLVALRLLGIGQRQLVRVPTDQQGRVDAPAFADAVAGVDGPCIACAQAGNVNTGSVDDLHALADAASVAGAWLHVDGAFGIWARAVPSLAHLAAGAERADSWATDAHKWLNVPYDCGVAIVRDPAALEAAVGIAAAYLARPADGARDPAAWTPELSRRGRAFPVWAALRSLGREGVVDLVGRTCELAERFAARLGAVDGVSVLNDVVLNQALVRFEGATAEEGDDLTRRVIARVQADGTCWLGGTVWHGMAAMRISVSGWRTTAEDVERSADAVVAAFDAERIAQPATRGG